MRFAWSAVLALGMAAAAWADDEDEKKKPAGVGVGLSLEELEARLNRLEALQDEETERLKKAAAKERQEEIEGLPARVSKLEKQAAATQPTWDPSKMLSFSSPDGNFTAKVGGRIYFIYRHVFERADGSPPPGSGGGAPDTLGLDTGRFQLDGTFFKDFYYRVEGEAQSQSDAGRFRFKDTYLGWQAVPEYFAIQGGQMKTPWSQEETCSSRFIDFGERSLLNRLAPAHDVGLLAKSTLAEKVVELNLGVFNGALTRDAGRNAVNPDDEFDVVGRIFLTPLKNSGNKFFAQTRVGFDFTMGDRDDAALPTGVTTGDLGGVNVNPIAAPAGVTADGIQQRMLVNFSWNYGPASLRAEYAVVNTELNDNPAALASDFDVVAYYLQATFLLTGEDKPLENRVKPKANLNLSEGTWGAFELAARIAFLDTSDGEDAGVVGALANQETTEIAVGLNWWWTPNMALRLTFHRFSFDEDLPVKSGQTALEDQQDVFYVRWQIDF